ncbi:hypothetical protein SHKM778_32950 [Streptomyces sp. KM77-8]|uniref:Polyketide synthase n=1 Tax=Streptomyces haneummycinicus TaxID=3074435 RepID=A0AAT9HHV6_9ACTN
MSADGFGVHPALLDACLHAIGVGEGGEGGSARLPFAWSGVSFHAVGATSVRLKLTFTGESVALEVADEEGRPVATVGSLVLREVSADRLAAAASAFHESLFQVDWMRLAGASGDGAVPGDVTVVRTEPGVDAGAVRSAVHRALEALHSEPGRVVFVTRGAVALPGEDVTDLAGAAVWGLVRSAQSEDPGRFVLVDVDAEGDVDAAVASALASGSPRSWSVRASRMGLDLPALRVLKTRSRPRLTSPLRARCWCRVPVARWAACSPGTWCRRTGCGVCCW